MTDQDRESFISGDSLGRVLQIIKEIAEKSADGDYIYRGEPEHYCRVSSSLYREYAGLNAESIDFGVVQEWILQAAREFAGQMDKNDTLAQLQHFGYSTNLIDFTTDFLVAFFFACDGEPAKDGRIILLQESKYTPIPPHSPANRVIAQKSVFVQTPQGFVEPDRIVSVPHDLKKDILEYLDKYHGVRAATIYNDLHGFIKYKETHQRAYRDFFTGLTYQQAGKLRKAVGWYKKALKLNLRLSVAYTNRGEAYRQDGKTKLAIQDFDNAIDINPSDDKAFGNRGIAYMMAGNLDRAIQDYDRAIEINPGNSIAHNSRGVAYRDKGMLDHAIENFDRALNLDPQFAGAFNNRGTTYLAKGEFDRAIKDIDRALELDPLYTGAIYNRGVTYAKQGNLDRAIQDFSKIIEMDPGDAGAFIARGHTHLLKGDFEPAMQDLSRAIEIDSGLSVAFYYRSLCWLVLKEWAKAEADLSTAKSLGFKIASAFRDEFESVAAFEERYKVKLPASIAEMLTAPGDE